MKTTMDRGISIHALREEGDPPQTSAAADRVISIHALREEGDAVMSSMISAASYFYPRPPRGGRPSAPDRAAPSSDFYPRPPRGGRRVNPYSGLAGFLFLSTPSARRATKRRALEGAAVLFLSTPSARRATSDRPPERRASMISIHALREEGDATRAEPRKRKDDFYPRPPRGGRRQSLKFFAVRQRFLSTPSARRATEHLQSNLEDSYISIHALREEGDQLKKTKKEDETYFYPRPPRGGRLYTRSPSNVATIFLSTPSARRATLN